jgi:hypothetical protein
VHVHAEAGRGRCIWWRLWRWRWQRQPKRSFGGCTRVCLTCTPNVRHAGAAFSPAGRTAVVAYAAKHPAQQHTVRRAHGIGHDGCRRRV